MVRTRVHGTRCAICGLRSRVKHQVELSYFTDDVWVWCHATLCRPCRSSILSIFRPRLDVAEVA